MTVLNAAQEEQLQEIGTHLRQVRQKKSISIEEVADKTHIRLRMLKALEGGQLDHLPEPVYIQGFIRRYGDFLGLDGNALAQTFPLDSPLVNLDTNVLVSDFVAAKSEPSTSEPNEDSSESSGINIPVSFSAKAIAPYGSYVLLSLLSIVAGAGLLYFFNRPSAVESASQKSASPAAQQKAPVTAPASSLPVASTSIPTNPNLSLSPSPSPTELSTQLQSTPTPVAPTTTPLSSPTSIPEVSASVAPTTTPLSSPTSTPEVSASVAPTTTPLSSPTSTPEVSASVAPPTTPLSSPESAPELSTQLQPTPLTTNPLGSPIQVAVNLEGESWVRVVADGKTIFEGTLQKGTQQTWTAERRLTIRSGNAGAVLVSVNQKEPQPLGKLGRVREATFTPEP